MVETISNGLSTVHSHLRFRIREKISSALLFLQISSRASRMNPIWIEIRHIDVPKLVHYIY